ncbi:MAG: helix-turn-helix domain-containing protein [Verrucomicrobia bacterium]|nr:helix-turn-helix domain-containing protein [Verrucomicrobiota bacterium]
MSAIIDNSEDRSQPVLVSRPSPELPRPSKRNKAAVRKTLAFADGERAPAAPDAHKTLIDALLASRLYQDYERAFTEATGLVVCLRPVESWQLPYHGKKNENPFCDLMAQKSKPCGVCLQVQQELSETATTEPKTVTCPVGFSDTAVPIRLGEQLIGFLQTGQVFRKAPTEAQFKRIADLMTQWGVREELPKLRKIYFATRVVPPRQHESVVKLLSIFAQHLSMVSNQVLVHQENSEPPVITRAKEFILEHQSEDLSLGQVAKAVNTSTFYFCKMFKKSTGINFTDYLSRVRIEKAKNLLLNPSLRISEIAFEVGFQSLTHFNRVFKKIIGQSPTQYRAQLPT